MICNVAKSELAGTIMCPASKSYTHRAVFLASLARGTSIIKNPLLSADTKATIAACEKFGAKITFGGDTLRITGTEKVAAAQIDAANSGTTIRIASAIASLAEGTSTLGGDESLSRRPMGSLLKALYLLGAEIDSDDGTPPVSITGRIDGGRVEIAGDISSQYVSALLIAGAATKKGIIVDVDGKLVSKDYVQYTAQAMERFGATVTETGTGYSCTNPGYTACEFTVPHDMSILALLVAAKMLSGEKLRILVGDCRKDSPSESHHVLEVCSAMGADVRFADGECIIEYRGSVKDCIDLTDQPDILPAVAIMALKSRKKISVTGIGHTKFKETDRIKVIHDELKKTGAHIDYDEDTMSIQFPENPKPAEFESRGDHRLFMAFCIAGMHIGGCTVTEPESVAVSYPNFIDDMALVGGKISLSCKSDC